VSLAIAAAFLPRHQIDDVVKVSLLLGIGGRVFAGEHAHEADIVRAVAQDLERLHQPSEPVALDAHLLFDLGGRLCRAGILGRRCHKRGALGRRPLGRRSLGRSGLLGRSSLGRSGGFGGRGLRLGRRSLRLGSHAARLDIRLGRGRFGARLDGRDGLGRRRNRSSAFGRRRRRFGRSWRGGVSRAVGATNDRRLAQDCAGELGDGLHGASISI
jgi:hypothetical protein